MKTNQCFKKSDARVLTQTRVKKRVTNRSGAILFEFAITLPVMLLLALAILDFGRIAFFRLLVADATGAASRYAATHPVTNNTTAVWQQQLENAARQSAQGSPWIDQANLLVLPATINEISPKEKRITVEVRYSFSTVLRWPGIPNQSTISNQVTLYGL